MCAWWVRLLPLPPFQSEGIIIKILHLIHPWLLGAFVACTPVWAQDSPPIDLELLQEFDLQGHRGSRGIFPENSIPGFLFALDLGVTTLEMDIAINAKGHAIVSHEPWMSAVICSHPGGRPVSEEEQQSLRIFAMSDQEVASFDCGSRGHPRFSRQEGMATIKPHLVDVIRMVEEQAKNSLRAPVRYNIEIKSLPEGDRVFHPEADVFADILIQILYENDIQARTTVQSFDTRALEAVHKIDATLATALLVENNDGFGKNLARLSFLPTVYSPYFENVDVQTVRAAHAQGVKIIPWTVNEKETMRSLIRMGVDGLITDYPDAGMLVLEGSQQTQ